MADDRRRDQHEEDELSDYEDDSISAASSRVDDGPCRILQRIQSKDPSLTVFRTASCTTISRRSPMTLLQAQGYANALTESSHVRDVRLDLSCCLPEALEAFLPYVRSSRTLFKLVVRTDRILQERQDTTRTAPHQYQDTVDRLYLAAAENPVMEHFASDVAAEPQGLVALLSKVNLKSFRLQSYMSLHHYVKDVEEHDPEDDEVLPKVDPPQARALAVGFSRNTSLREVALEVDDDADDGSGGDALRTIVDGLYRHPCLQDLRMDVYKNDHDNGWPASLSQLLHSSPSLQRVKILGSRFTPTGMIAGRSPLDLSALIDVRNPTRLDSLELSGFDFVGTVLPQEEEEDSRLSVSNVSLNSCNFASAATLKLLCRLSGLERLELNVCGGFGGADVERNSSPRSALPTQGPIESLVEKHKGLSSITIRASQVEDEHIVDVAQSLLHFDTVKDLSISGYTLVSRSADLLMINLRNNRGLERLHLDWGGNLDGTYSMSGAAAASMLQSNKTLVRFDLDVSTFSEEDMYILCRGLVENSTLKCFGFPVIHGENLPLV